MKTLLETYISIMESENLNERHIIFIGEEANSEGVGKYISLGRFKELANVTPDSDVRKLVVVFKDGKVLHRSPTGHGWQLHLPFRMPEKIDFIYQLA